MAAKINLNGRGEPPEAETIVFSLQERGLRKIHLTGHTLHPTFITGLS
jgi:hypothetical protein